MKSTSTTEQEMREETAPTPNSVEELSEYVASLVDRKHDYGTCVYAMSLSATAAFNMVASMLGVTGFQASCADMDILTRTRMLKGPWIILKAEDALYPQSDPVEKLSKVLDEWKPWLQEQAAKKLAETKSAHPDVIEHWTVLAYRENSSEYVEAMAKARFLDNKFTQPFIERNVEKFKQFGLTDVYLTGDESVERADSCEEGCTFRLNLPVSLQFHRNIGGIKSSWSIDTELPDSNGKSEQRIDFEKLASLEAAATNPDVKAAIQTYTAKARG